LKIVAVSQRVNVEPNNRERQDALDQRMSAFLVEVGLLPVPIPNGLLGDGVDAAATTAMLERWVRAISPGALVLSGGCDIGVCPDRDSTERWLLSHAEMRSLPVLGICRGMQMMAVRAGVELKRVHGHVRTRHDVRGKIGGSVNSYHAFSLTACPERFSILATSADGEIEAIGHQELPWEGWMWHPEREPVFGVGDISRARELLVSCNR